MRGACEEITLGLIGDGSLVNGGLCPKPCSINFSVSSDELPVSRSFKVEESEDEHHSSDCVDEGYILPEEILQEE